MRKEKFYEYTPDFLFDKDYFNNQVAIHKRIESIKMLSVRSQLKGIKNCYNVTVSIFHDSKKKSYIDYIKNFYILKQQVKTLEYMLKKLDDDYNTESLIYYCNR